VKSIDSQVATSVAHHSLDSWLSSTVPDRFVPTSFRHRITATTSIFLLVTPGCFTLLAKHSHLTAFSWLAHWHEILCWTICVILLLAETLSDNV